MDFADAVNQLITHFEETCSSWQIQGFVFSPNLKGTQEQTTNMELLPIEFVDQRGDGDYGYHGNVFFPTTYSNGDGGYLYLHVTFSG